jgi:Protein of unknown function (DUF1588)/Protein of unknown function (DUF1585)/Protein of unknown function (DUF1592)
MLEETRTFVDETLRKNDGTFAQLLTSSATYVTPELAKFYGYSIAPGSPTVGGMSRVERDPGKHAGILTMGSVLSTLAHEAQGAAVLRGTFVLGQLLCKPPPPPPCAANLQLPSPDPKKTRREQLQEVTGVGTCKGCHLIINPPGFAFENFNAVGRYEDKDQGKPIDASGSLLGPGDATGSYTNISSMAATLAKSETVRSCAVTNWFNYAYGRGEGQADKCSSQQLKTAFEASGGNVKKLLLELTQTPAFLFRTSLTSTGAKP